MGRVPTAKLTELRTRRDIGQLATRSGRVPARSWIMLFGIVLLATVAGAAWRWWTHRESNRAGEDPSAQVRGAIADLEGEFAAQWMRRAAFAAPVANPTGGSADARLRTALDEATANPRSASPSEIQLGRAMLALSEWNYAAALELANQVEYGEVEFWGALRWHIRGDALFGLGRWQEAREAYARIPDSEGEGLLRLVKVILCLTNCVELDGEEQFAPELAICRGRLGVELDRAGRPEEAFRQYEASLAVCSRLLGDRGSPELTGEFAGTLYNYGVSLHRHGRYEQSLQQFTRAENVLRELVRTGHLAFEVQLGDTLIHRGSTASMTRDFEAALLDQEQATELFTRLFRAEPSPQLMQRLVSSLNNRALLLGELRRDDEALRDYDRAVALMEQQAAADGTTYSVELGLCLMNRGNLHRKLGRLSKASADYLRSVELLSVETNSTMPRHWDVELATSLKEYGLLKLEAGDFVAGVDALERAVRLFEPNLRSVQSDVYYSELAEAKAALAKYYAAPGSRHGDATKAVRYATHACDLTGWSEPRFIETLGAAVAAAGDAESAARWERRAAAKRRAP